LSYGLKAGLTLVDIKVESTFLLPGDAVINSNLKTEAPISPKVENAKAKSSNAFTNFDSGADSSDTLDFVPGEVSNGVSDDDDDEPIVNEKKERIKTIIIPIVIFIVCVLLGFGVTFMIFNMKDLISFTETTTVLPNTAGSVLYAASDGVPVYSQNSLDSTVIGSLRRGDVVTLQEITDDTFSKVVTVNNVTGYVLSAQLLAEDPTYNDPTTAMISDPTPVPTSSLESTTHMTTTAVQTDQWGGGTTTTTTTETTISPTPSPSPTPGQTVEPGEPTPAEPTPAEPTPAEPTPAEPTPADNGGGSGDNGGGSGDNGGGSGDNGGGSGDNGGGSGDNGGGSGDNGGAGEGGTGN
jgi:uncharacterized membrane protein YgcG